MKYLILGLLLTSCGFGQQEREEKITQKAEQYCSCNGGIDNIQFLWDAAFSNVKCNDGTVVIIKPNSIVKNCSK